MTSRAAGTGDDLLVVFAHSLLGPAMGAGAVAKILRDRPALAPDKRTELLELIIERSQLVIGVLGDIARAGSPALVDALDQLGRPREQCPEPHAQAASPR